ncbi:MAG: hypothetical protein Q4B01_04715 [Eubacteriales bacterium]|nr:hypothetical protein [Eubacteriales bacterium]
MHEKIEAWIRRPVTVVEDSEIVNKLPLIYIATYQFFRIKHDGMEWELVQPKEKIRLNKLERAYEFLVQNLGLSCAFYFDTIQYYKKEALIDRGIPYIWSNKQMYLPFLGMILSNKPDRILNQVHEISFLTQKLILCAMYGDWENCSTTSAAKFLDVSKTSITRCMDEIEGLQIPILDYTGKYRKISVPADKKEFWENIKDKLRSPVIERFQLEEDIALQNKAGISALSEMSMISDNVFPTYGVQKKDIKALEIRMKNAATMDSVIGCEILELGYYINFQDKGIQDPLSCILSLSELELEDERIQMCIDEMLEEYVW